MVQQSDWALGYWPTVFAGHIAWGSFEYSRWQNYRNNGEVSMLSIECFIQFHGIEAVDCLWPDQPDRTYQEK